MNWFDYLLLAIVGASALVGLFRGLVKEALSLVVWVLAIWAAWNLAGLVEPRLSGLVADPALRLWAARAAVLVGVLVLGGLTTTLISFLLDRTGLTGTDRLLGMLFGLGRGAILATLVVIALEFAGFDADPWWQQSKLIPYAAPIAERLRDAAAQGMDMLDAEMPGASETPAAP